MRVDICTQYYTDVAVDAYILADCRYRTRSSLGRRKASSLLHQSSRVCPGTMADDSRRARIRGRCLQQRNLCSAVVPCFLYREAVEVEVGSYDTSVLRAQ
jgi:hypothetical protein